jgi:hypothetical protein
VDVKISDFEKTKKGQKILHMKLRRCEKSLRPWTPVTILPLGSFDPVKVFQEHISALPPSQEGKVFQRYYTTSRSFSTQVLGKCFVDALAKQVAKFLGKEVSFESVWKEKRKN